MIRGYPVPSSVLPGETLVLHVSTDQPKFRVEIYRQEVSLVRMEEGLGWQTGYHAPPAPMGEDWGWFCYGFDIPDDWQSGVYIARLIEGNESGIPIGDLPADLATADGFNHALFVVKSAAPGDSASILYKLPLFTYQAYAGKIDWTTDDEQENLYSNSYNGANDTGLIIPETLHRPGGGTGEGHDAMHDLHDLYDREAFLTSFEHFDAKFVRWFETNGYKVDYCTDLDVHEDPDLLTHYRLLVIGGHDEYWSEDERQHVEDFVHSGGNLAIFNGNTCWRIVHLENGNTTMRCNKKNLDPRPHVDYDGNIEFDLWFAPNPENFPTGNPENSLTGLSFRHGGSKYDEGEIGYTVQHADHWVFTGTNLHDGNTFGSAEHLIYGEFDGTPLEADSTGYKVPIGTDRTGTPTGTPEDFIILGFADMGAGKATMGLFTNGGIVFNAATTSWPRVLSRGDPHVDRITRNVIDHLGLQPVRIVGPLPTACGSAVAVEGRTAQFYVDTSAIGDTATLSYKWSISGGAGSLLDEPVLEAIMPSPPSWITVTVTVSDSEGHPQGFGTRTFLPLTLTEFLTLTMSCLSRELMPRPAGVGVEDQVWHRIMHEDPLRFAQKYHLIASTWRSSFNEPGIWKNSPRT